MRHRSFSIACACFATAWLFVTWLFPRPVEMHRYAFPDEAQWITVPANDIQAQATRGFRFDFELPPLSVERAWLAVSADTGFEVLLNGNPLARWDLYRPSRPFQSGHSAYGQRLSYKPPALALNYPREFQWSDNSNERLPMFIDITRSLTGGQRNALCVIAHARHEKPAFCLTGEILLSSGQKIILNSNENWRSPPEHHPLSDREWQQSNHLIGQWPLAQAAHRPNVRKWRFAPEGIFESPFSGQWLTTPHDGARHTFSTNWSVSDSFDKAFLRVACDADYLLKINGETIRTMGGSKRHESDGEWIARPAGRRILSVDPELLDPDEASSNYIGEEFLNPRHGDPTSNEFTPAKEPLNLSQDSFTDEKRGDLLRRARDEKAERPGSSDGTGERITNRRPIPLSHNVSAPVVTGFDVSHWLKPGDNAIEIIAIPRAEDLLYNKASASRIAVDGGLDSRLTLASDANWNCDGTQALAGRVPQASQLTHDFRRITQPAPAGRWLPWLMALAAFLAAQRGLLKDYTLAILTTGVFAACGLLFEISMRERSEQAWLEGIHWWRLAVILFGVTCGFLFNRSSSQGAHMDATESERTKMAWPMRIGLLVVLLVAFLARIWQLDLQPLDDDEYASVQATLSIAKKGVPELAPGIYYTRGPAYHYAAAVFVMIFGDNIWALRMPAILAGVICVFFTYLLGSRLLKSRTLGLAAALLLALHPFCIFTAHIARFYQQQQTLTVATVFFFISGFVQNGKSWHRTAAIICAALAVLSQEISLLIAVPFCFCYALMARPMPVRAEFKLLLAAGLAGAVIFLNLLVFKVVCLTRLEGISPNVESTLKPHFYEPQNFLSMWLGYSRLHVFLGVFSIVGMIAGIRKRDPGMIATTFFLVFGIIGTVLLVTATGFRYQFSVLPLWILTAVFGIRVAASHTAKGMGRPAMIKIGLAISCFGILSFSPWRILESYNLRILGDSSSATGYVRANLRPGDRVAITEPHPHAALIEVGRADYDIAIPILYDFVYRDETNGKLIDRNGGAESMGRLGTLQRAMAQHDRIWIMLNREKFRTRGRNLRWEYPGSRFDLFVRQNCQLAYRAYLWDVYLWDRTSGKIAQFRLEPEGWFD